LFRIGWVGQFISSTPQGRPTILRVGFADAAHFGKVFKRLMQCMPGEYAARAAA
jgi:transcriptional regulator GlxA family with amidase domain